MIWLLPRCTFFPYTTLFRSPSPGGAVADRCARLDGRDRLGRGPNGELCMSPLQRGHAKLAIRPPAQAIAPIQASATISNGASWRRRTEERRVRKKCTSREEPYHLKKKKSVYLEC